VAGLNALSADDPAALAESDAGEPLALAVAAQDHFIAIIEEFPDFTSGQVDRFGATPGQFEQATTLVRLGSGDGAAGQKIAGLQVAAVAGVVRE
jgi:hypothetical protein